MERETTGDRDREDPRGTVLVTGATGFVGGELLGRLVGDDPRPIVCLVRAESNADATARGLGVLAALLGRMPTPREQERITWLAGDLTQAGLGLRSDRWWRLAETLKEIFHCAASTRFDLPLDAAQLVNVRGLEEIYELACAAVDAGRFRRLNHVSTAYASGRTSARIDAEHLPSDRAAAYRNTYERTKADAERLLRTQSRVPYTIYRPSIIVGDSRDGHTSSWNVVYFPMRLMASGHLPVAPMGGRALLDCVPVDFVADAILTLARRRDTAGRAFHLTAGDDALTVEDVVRHTYAGLARRRRAEPRVQTRLLGPIAWWAFAKACRLLRGAQARRVLERFEQYAPYTRVSAIYDSSAERALLAQHGIRLPSPEAFFPRIVDYALRHDFGRRPAPAPRDPALGTDAAAAAMGGM
jgi:thioester reductase-like protein